MRVSNDPTVCADSCTTHLELRKGLVRQSEITSQACWDWEELHRCDRSMHNLQRRFIEGDIVQTRCGRRYFLRTSGRDHSLMDFPCHILFILRASRSAECRLPWTFTFAAATRMVRRLISGCDGTCRHWACDARHSSSISSSDGCRKSRAWSSAFSIAKTGAI